MLALLCAWPSSALAAEVAPGSTVVIVFDPRAGAVSQRLRQEIEALGFDVQLKAADSAATPLEDVALEARAIAAIRVEPLAAGGVEMTVLDRATGKTVHRDLTRVSARDAAGEELIATRTVELFRASLMELNASHPPRGQVRATKPVVELVSREAEVQLRQRSGAVFVAAGPALLGLPRFERSAQFWLQAAWLSKIGFGVGAELFSPLSAARLSAPEGSVELRSTCYRLGVLWDFGSNDTRFGAQLGAGWSLTTVSVRGTALEPYVGSQDDFVSHAPWLSVSGRARISSHFALRLQISGSHALPRATIRLAGREVADFARPSYFASVGPELSWP